MGLYTGAKQALWTPRTAAAAGPPNGLLTNLVYCYELDEASGTRADSHTSGLTLTDNNTVTSVARGSGNAAEFTLANTEYLSHVDDALYDPGSATHIHLGFWFYFKTLPGSGGIQVLLGHDNGNTGYAVYVENNGGTIRLQMRMANTDDGQKTILASTFGTPSTATWYRFDGWYDNTAKVIKIAINNGTADASTAMNRGPDNSDQPYRLGTWGGSLGSYFNGYLDQVAMWTGALLTTDQKTALYGAGAGLPFSSWTA